MHTHKKKKKNGSPESQLDLGRVWLVRPRTGFTRTARLVGTAPVLGRPEHVLLAPASRPEQTEQFHFFTVKPGGNIDFGPK